MAPLSPMSPLWTQYYHVSPPPTSAPPFEQTSV
eukprot:CAMPEP_0202906014 /NCGR_PEP_ID=MMETSP1392-20130828/37028_1 /ASSEMBLY_ACC=CAM_ASM_000868 /TAXON_ID=225041 /ORGANISM="Chlamydomonas chlamydogama, Strain SAG 11-48b" /LENGTH=32 /DNA_ID= /DNA_START= /DNA_END= /DNA_ORIENTATION=